MKFSDLRLSEPLTRAVASEGYDVPTPIQAKSIPFILEGRDMLGSAQTGTGKTAAFALPILHRLAAEPAKQKGKVRCLVLCPTRELALQIKESFDTYGRHYHFKTVVVFGGVNQNPQADALRRGVDIVIATPGRLLDLMNQRLCDLRNIETLVLDEADRMLDMGFIHDIRRITAHIPKERQTLLFSATMPDEIRSLAHSLLRNPALVEVAPPATTVELIDQSVYFVDRGNKSHLLAHLFNDLPMSRVIVFTRTKHGADRVVKHLEKFGIRAEAIHGNKSQNARERALENFRKSKTPILVATDIASRGIDVDGISHVVNYDLTHEPETYVHRIGRTARAGASGAAVSFCDRDERSNLKAIEKLIRRTIAVKDNHPVYTQADRTSAPRELSHAQPRDGRNAPRGSQRDARPQAHHASREGRAPQAHAPKREARPQQTHSRDAHPHAAAKPAPRTQPARHPLSGKHPRNSHRGRPAQRSR